LDGSHTSGNGLNASVNARAFSPNPDESFDVSKDNLVALNGLSGNEPADIVTDAASTPNVFVRNRCDTSIPDGLCSF
jgi:hypothetical protein